VAADSTRPRPPSSRAPRVSKAPAFEPPHSCGPPGPNRSPVVTLVPAPVRPLQSPMRHPPNKEDYPMEIETWMWAALAIGAAVIVLALIALAFANKRRSDGLKDRFGHEYDRVVTS